jgi:predicted metal-dependent hydrolase
VSAPPAERVTIRARPVRFDWTATPLHWVPGDPQTTHTINVLHLLLPAGERWFVRLYRRVLPDVTDERLRADVRGFVGQEATHAKAHSAVLDHLYAQGVDPAPFTRRIDWMFDRLLGDRPLGLPLPAFAARAWTRRRLAIVAAIEHVTAVLGWWVLGARGLDAARPDPTMLDLLRWHGAEEVEHRAVAHDLYQHLDGSYLRRVTAMAVVAPLIVWFFVRGTSFLMAADPTGPGRPTVRGYRRAARAGSLPGPALLARAVPRYLRRDHHPLDEGSTAVALAYLARSPAAGRPSPTVGESRPGT